MSRLRGSSGRRWALAVVVTLAASTAGASRPAAASAPSATVVNLELGLQGLPPVALDGGRVGFAVYEADQSQDLNADGDQDDRVVHVHDRLGGTTTNTEVAGYGLVALEGGRLAFLASEQDQGRDLNADGEFASYDYVLHVFDPATGLMTNTELAAGALVALAGGQLALMASERGQQQDFTDDGDTTDSVLHVYDPEPGAMSNVGVAGTGWPMALDGGKIAFAADEYGEAASLNGDFDWYDAVVHVYDPADGQVQNLQVSGPSNLLTAVPGGLAIPVSERDQGNQDLSGDGDATDYVLHLYDAASGLTTDTSLVTHYARPISDGHGNIVAITSEAALGRSLNADTDTDDVVPRAYDTTTGTVTSTGVAAWPGSSLWALDGTGVTFFASEAGEGRSLNADSDTSDNVLHVLDATTGTLRSVGLAGPLYAPLALDGGLLAFHASEAAEGRDLDGTTWSDNAVLHVFDPATSTVTNLRIAYESTPVALDAGRMAFLVSEYRAGEDLNEDGDNTDRVVHLYDATTGALTNGGLATHGWLDVYLGGDTVAVLASEYNEGASLNGDADLTDQVLHLVTFRTFVDADGDEFAPGEGGDADDSDNTIYPGAPELCDGKDNDQDDSVDEGWADADTDLVADCVDPDDDGDGLADGQDPDGVAVVVAGLPRPAFGSEGQRRAALDRLDVAEALIAAGDVDRAVDELLALAKRVDGCDGSTRERADKNDWITDCAAQRQVAELLGDLIDALTAPTP